MKIEFNLPFLLLVGVGELASNTSVINADNTEFWCNFDNEAKIARVIYKGESFLSSIIMKIPIWLFQMKLMLFKDDVLFFAKN